MDLPYFEILLCLPLCAIPKLASSCSFLTPVLKSDYFWQTKAQHDIRFIPSDSNYTGVKLYQYALLAAFFKLIDRFRQTCATILCLFLYTHPFFNRPRYKPLLLSGCPNTIDLLLDEIFYTNNNFNFNANKKL